MIPTCTTCSRISPTAWAEDGSAEYPLGTDTMSRCLLSRIIYGARVSVAVGVPAIIVAGLIGVILGLVAGHMQGY